MEGTSNLIILLTLVLVVSLAMVLGLVLLLLAELYCSPLLLLHRRRCRRRHVPTPNATNTGDNPSTHSLSHSQSPIGSFRCTDPNPDLEKQLPTTQSPENQDSGGKVQIRNGSPLVYISNPVYDGESRRGKPMEDDDTPFETPDSSPSRLETEDESSGDDEKEVIISSEVVDTLTPPLTPMKKLPAGAVSVCMKDVRSLGTYCCSDTNSNNGASSSSLTTCPSHSL
ncbi:hypothetical protein LXL04_002560 [Taraxacum kok-saghyz]